MSRLDHLVSVAGERITATTDPGPELSLNAGMIDLQVNGGWGHDFTTDPASIWEVGRHLPITGVTAFLPTIVSAPYDIVDEAITVLAGGPPPGYLGAEPLGLHVEGPWISPVWKGAHNPEHLRLPDPGVARSWAASGRVRMVTIAPELDAAFAVAGSLDEAGVIVSAGHSDADFETASRALAGPWSAVTHLFNQMTRFHHRTPGLIGAALLSDRPCGVIADGVHGHHAALRLAWHHLAPHRLILVTDAMAAVGLGPGKYPLGDRRVEATANGPRIDGVLAGSLLTLDRAVANLADWTSASTAEAVASASTVPASLLGDEDRGRLGEGSRADAVLCDDRFQVLETMVGGKVVYEAEKG